MYPTAVYLVKYDCDGKMNGALLECSDAFAEEVKKWISLYGIQS